MSTNSKAQQQQTGSNAVSGNQHALPPSTMVGVVEEQKNDLNMVHILPLGPTTSRDATTANVTSASNTDFNLDARQKEDDQTATETSTLLSKNLPTLSEEPSTSSLKADLLQKKPSTEPINPNLIGSNTLSSINDMKLKKTTNPSMSSLRAMSLQGNYPTVSSASTTLTKGSTRAEYFAAKLHDAIKSDRKIQNEAVETFVYDTTTKTPPVDQTIDNIDTVIKTSTKEEKYKTASSVLPETVAQNLQDQNRYKEKLQNVFNPDDSPVSYKTLDDNFDSKSRSSGDSRKNSRKRSFKSLMTQVDPANLQPLSKVDNTDNKSVNQLRQITSRLFDSKAVQPRRYSGIDSEYNNDDSYDGDIDYYEPSISNPTLNQGNTNSITYSYNNKNNSHRNSNGNNPFDYIINESDYEDELSSYFSPNYNPSSQKGKASNSNYLNKQQIHGNLLTVPDYGSMHGDNKRLLRKRNDIYNSPHDFTSVRAQRLKQIRSFCYTVSAIFMLLFLGFISGFVLATNKELQNLKVTEIRNTIISQEELVFDMVFSAFNPGLMPISIDTVQLDIFAKTNYLSTESVSKSYETVLLGAVEALDVPLYFQGGFLNRQKDVSKTEIKLINPCSYDKGNGDDDHHNDGEDNDDDSDDAINEKNRALELENYESYESYAGIAISESSLRPISHIPDPRWVNISRNPFDLIVRGAMMYKLPFSSQNHTVSISYTTYIDPGYDYYSLELN
ncbi:hypothetical protein PICMEDRAFT_9712 [Pichia membranifaciens NRRL Y-2026]|uniref:Vacuolar segregation protein 7 n=1 Tax=Pichia membranifaciens NRRL Y-2026 TaxID=763406 RepID=A0A1E3NT59_9ASCO|nr:hypothetical protein PICMEDRAFT_9712 [Pichia membranifaciens NRRL Y-2026]ODQ49234.1 hypothetical protein PICMEDRAFT_9712 [Pichia membranifaciens NRRL Y-2026]